MSLKPELVRPLTSRPYLSNNMLNSSNLIKKTERSLFAEIKNEAGKITEEDLLKLKKERQILLQEKQILKAKITRFEDLAKRSKNQPIGERSSTRSKIIENSLQKQIENLERMIEGKKSEINMILGSDSAVVISELQEESKMYHMEIIRLENEKIKAEADYNDSLLKLEYSGVMYTEKNLNSYESKLSQLQRDVEIQKEKNQKLRKKIEIMKAVENDSQILESQQRVKKQIEATKGKIHEEKMRIKEIEGKIEQSKKAIYSQIKNTNTI